MIKKTNKRAMFIFYLIASSVIGFFLHNNDGWRKGKVVELSSLTFDTPLFSIEKAYGSDGAGGCSGSGCSGSDIYFPPAASGVVIGITKI